MIKQALVLSAVLAALSANAQSIPPSDNAFIGAVQTFAKIDEGYFGNFISGAQVIAVDKYIVLDGAEGPDPYLAMLGVQSVQVEVVEDYLYFDNLNEPLGDKPWGFREVANPIAAPEIGMDGAAASLTLLLGGIMVLRSRRRSVSDRR